MPTEGFDKHPENINRKGRPKGPSILDHIKSILEEDGIELGTTKARDVAKVVIDAAIESKDLTQCRDLIDRVDGRALQKIEVSSEADLQWLEVFKNLGNRAESEAETDNRGDDTEPTSSAD